MGSTFSASVWHLQGLQRENGVLCQRRTLLFDRSISGALRVSSRASAVLLSHSSHGRFGCAVSSLRKPENGTQSTRLFFRFHTMISQGEQPDHRRVRPSLTIHFHSCKFKAGVTSRWLSGSVRVQISLAHRVIQLAVLTPVCL